MRITVCLPLFIALLGNARASSNVTFGRPTRQSSQYASYRSDLAVDGDFRSALKDRTCTHTLSEEGSWWAVDLGDVYSISNVTIVNRGDCCQNRLKDFNILLSEDDEFSAAPNISTTLCAYHDGGLELGEIKTIECNNSAPNLARIVMIQLTGKGALTLCEVQVGVEDWEDISSTIPEMSPSSHLASSMTNPLLATTSSFEGTSTSLLDTRLMTSSRVSSEHARTSSSVLSPSSVTIFESSLPFALLDPDEECVCRCDEDEEAARERIKLYVKQIKTNLTVSRNSTSLYLRKLSSAPDARPSAQSIGLMGVSLCGVILGVLVLLDCLSVVQKLIKIKKSFGKRSK